MSGSQAEIERLKKRVEALEIRMDNMMRMAGHDIPKPEAKSSDEVMECLSAGRKIEAIKIYRRETGASLKDAKEFIESLMN